MADEFIGTLPADPNPLANALRGTRQAVQTYTQTREKQEQQDRKQVNAIMDFAQQSYGSEAYKEVQNRLKNSPEMVEKINKYRPEFLRKTEDGGYTLNVPEPEGFKKIIDETPGTYVKQSPTGEIETIAKPKELVEGNPENYSVQIQDNQLLVFDQTGGEPELIRREDITNEDRIASKETQLNFATGQKITNYINANGDVVRTTKSDSPTVKQFLWNKEVDEKKLGFTEDELELQEEKLDEQQKQNRRNFALDLMNINLRKRSLEQQLEKLNLEKDKMAADYRNLRLKEDTVNGEDKIVSVVGERYNPESGEWVTEELDGIPSNMLRDFVAYQQLKSEQKKAGKTLPDDPVGLAVMAGNVASETMGDDPTMKKSGGMWSNAINTVANSKIQSSEKYGYKDLPKLRGKIMYEMYKNDVIPHSVKDGTKVPYVKPNEVLSGESLNSFNSIIEERGNPGGTKTSGDTSGEGDGDSKYNLEDYPNIQSMVANEYETPTPLQRLLGSLSGNKDFGDPYSGFLRRMLGNEETDTGPGGGGAGGGSPTDAGTGNAVQQEGQMYQPSGSSRQPTEGQGNGLANAFSNYMDRRLGDDPSQWNNPNVVTGTANNVNLQKGDPNENLITRIFGSQGVASPENTTGLSQAIRKLSQEDIVNLKRGNVNSNIITKLFGSQGVASQDNTVSLPQMIRMLLQQIQREGGQTNQQNDANLQNIGGGL